MPANNSLNPENQWKGVNERIEPVLLPEDIYSQVDGLVYRHGMGCRVNGKLALYKFDSAVCNIANFVSIIIVQTLNAIYTIPIADLSISLDTLQAENGDYLQDELGNYLTNG